MQVSKAGMRAIQAVALEMASELNSLADDIASHAEAKTTDAEELIGILWNAVDALKEDTAPRYDKRLDDLNTRYIKYADI